MAASAVIAMMIDSRRRRYRRTFPDGLRIPAPLLYINMNILSICYHYRVTSRRD